MTKVNRLLFLVNFYKANDVTQSPLWNNTIFEQRHSIDFCNGCRKGNIVD